MHWGNTDMLLATSLRFGLDMPASAVPRRNCPCGWTGVQAAGAHVGAAHRGWARHVVQSCPKSAGQWTIAHNAVQDVLVVMLKNAGFVNVEVSSREWRTSSPPPFNFDQNISFPTILFQIMHPWTQSLAASIT
eukprot:SAG11_NODE_4181_length_2025_cov_1.713396_2_plen_133_part_00